MACNWLRLRRDLNYFKSAVFLQHVGTFGPCLLKVLINKGTHSVLQSVYLEINNICKDAG
jgi:hypothetical protein